MVEMIQISDTTQPGNDSNAAPALYIVARLPDNYPITDQDVKWLEVCGDYLEGEATNESVLAATKNADRCSDLCFELPAVVTAKLQPRRAGIDQRAEDR